MSPTRVSGLGKTSLLHRRRRQKSPKTAAGRRRNRPILEALEDRQLLSTYAVTNTDDSGAGSLRQAIINANKDSSPDDIVFNIPASTAPEPECPGSGFRPGHADLEDHSAKPFAGDHQHGLDRRI